MMAELEICCQCDDPTGRAGRADDSLYTDCDWGPYCPDCWQDADYWRCIADEKGLEAERLRDGLQIIFPMAKGYVAEHDVGRNQEMVAEVQTLMSVKRTEGSDG